MRISEIFHSIQGEGGLVGIPSAFVRTAGCNLRCAWCDTKHASWNAEGVELSVDDIATRVLAYPTRFCVITGGEPTEAPGLPELVGRLRAHGKHVTLETNGTNSPNGLLVDLASISPKLGNSEPDPRACPVEARMQSGERRLRVDVLREWIDSCDYQLKFVVSDASDLHEIREVLNRLERDVPPEKVMLMPEGADLAAIRSRDEILLSMCKEYGYRYCPRLHVEMFGNRRGV